MFPMKRHGLLRCVPNSPRLLILTNVPFQLQKLALKRAASGYFGDISTILATVDRQLLLIMKTNDLIRSIAYTLGNDERRSFLVMTRACFQSLQDRRARETNSKWVRFGLLLHSQWFYFKLYVYSFYLWLTWTGPKAIKRRDATKAQAVVLA